MRRDGRIRRISVVVAWAAGASLLGAIVDPSRAANADSTAAWLPLPIEEVVEPDRLEDESPRLGAAIRADRRDSGFEARRAVVTARFGPRLIGVSWLARGDRAPWATITAARPGRSAVAAGAVVVRDAAPLLAQAMGWSRGSRRPSPPREAAPSFEAPPSPASLAIVGAAASAAGRLGAGWLLAGRREEDRARIAAGGVGAPVGRLAWAVAAGAVEPDAEAGSASGAGARRIVSLTARVRPEGRSLAAEMLIERGRAPTAAIEAAASSGSVGLETRWRRRPGEARPVAGEWAALVRGRAASARVTWRPWSSRAPGDDGTLEAEGTWDAPGFGPARLRVGAKRGGEDPETPRERYLVLDAVVASERGRSLALLASRRERGAGVARGVGTSIGGRLTLSARGRASGTLVVESARTGSAAASSAAGAAWTTGITPSGASALETRGRSGVAASAGGWVRLGSARLRALLRDAEGADQADRGHLAATLWLEWGE
ncbi:MAG TPA: hypothetical protein VF363_09960 [Candidatus Eisenbacteria bacterium]